MGWNFQKRIRLFKGVTLNLGKTGASVTVGRQGASVNIGRRGGSARVGLPGSGLSYRTGLWRNRRTVAGPDGAPPATGPGWGGMLFWVVVLSSIAWLVWR